MCIRDSSFVLSVVGLVSFPSIVFRGRLLAVPAIILILFSLFAGSGQIGLEALSRGAAYACLLYTSTGKQNTEKENG